MHFIRYSISNYDKLINDMENRNKINLIHKEIEKESKYLELAKRVWDANNRKLSLEHTLMNMLQLSGYEDITLSDVQWALSTYNPYQKDPQQKIEGEKEQISLDKARELIYQILKEKKSIKSSTIMMEEFFNRGFKINQNSLKVLLSRMTNEKLIKNDKDYGGWILIDRT